MGSTKKNFIYNASYQLLVILIPLITTPYISRVLGAEGVGTYAYVFSVANYFVLFIMLGVNNYGNRTISASRDNTVSTNFVNIYLSQFILGCLAVVIYIVYSVFISSNTTVSLILGLYVLSGVIDVNWFLNGLEQFKMIVLRNSLIKLLSVTLIFMFIKTKTDVNKYCLIMAASYLLSQVVVWPYVVKKIHFVRPNKTEFFIHLKGNIRLFASVLAVSLYKVMDKIMLGAMVGNAQVGFFELSEKVINVPLALITALGVVMLPRMSNRVASNTKGDEKIIRISIIFVLAMASSLCFGIMGIAEEFVPLYYGDGYEICISLFMILLPSCLFLAFANVIRTQFLLPRCMDKIYITSTFLGAVVNLLSNAILIPKLQVQGAAIGTLLAEIAVCVYQSYMCRQYLPIKFYVKQCLPTVIAGIIMLIVLKLISFPEMTLLWRLICKVAIGALVYLTAMGLMYVFLKKQYKDLI